MISRVAAADVKADCNFLEIARDQRQGRGARSGSQAAREEAQAPPFSSYNVFHKLSSGAVTLAHLKAETLPLKQGGASLLLREKTDKRAELTVTMDGADGKRALDVKQAWRSATGWSWSIMQVTTGTSSR